jgi:hypothetical protein
MVSMHIGSAFILIEPPAVLHSRRSSRLQDTLSSLSDAGVDTNQILALIVDAGAEVYLMQPVPGGTNTRVCIINMGMSPELYVCCNARTTIIHVERSVHVYRC